MTASRSAGQASNLVRPVGGQLRGWDSRHPLYGRRVHASPGQSDAAISDAAAATSGPKREPGRRVIRSTGPLMLTAARIRRVGASDRRAHRRHARLALLDRLDPTDDR